jgi:polar amino acid transport system substrate-binding protein
VAFVAPDGKTFVESDHDLIRAVARKLGLEIAYVNAEFTALITAFQSDRIHVPLAAMSDAEERQQRVDSVDYMAAETTALVQEGNPSAAEDLEDLCGKGVAVVVGTVQQQVLEEVKANQCAQKPSARVIASGPQRENARETAWDDAARSTSHGVLRG